MQQEALARANKIMGEMKTPEPFCLVLFGPPGSGKGTYGNIISPHYKLPIIGTGDLVRAEVKSGSDLGKRIQAISQSGGLVSDDVIIDMVKHRIAQADCREGFILDGFPRTVPQAEALTKFCKVSALLDIDLSFDIIRLIATGRRACPQCRRGYNVHKVDQDGVYMASMSPLNPHQHCDDCPGGVKLFQRADDQPDVINNRLKVYSQQTAPVKDYLANHGVSILTHKVKRGRDDWPQVIALIDEYLSKHNKNLLQNKNKSVYASQ